MKVTKFELLLGLGQVGIGDGEPTDAEKAAAQKAADDKVAAEKAKPKTFTQDELNEIVKKERKTKDEQIQKQIELNDQLSKSKGLTEAERQRLAEHNEQLKNELLSKEELAAKERQRLAEQHTSEVKGLATERDSWKERYNKAEIARGIADATILHEAVNSEQVDAILRPWTSMVEEVGADGKGTGHYSPKVRFPTVDKDNKPITLDLSIAESVKLMKETPARFGNLFKANLTAGLGMGGGAKRTVQDLKNIPMGDYIAQRRKDEGKTK